MNRVATIPTHRNLFNAIGRSQQRLSEVQVQMATGKKAKDFAALGTETIRNLSARTLVARQEAHGAVANRLQTTLAIYDANMSGVEESMMSLRTELLKTIGTGRSAGLQGAIEEAFQRFRYGMNSDEGGLPLFAGTQTDGPPFRPSSLADLVGLPADQAFANDQVKATARVADGLNVEYGVLASEIGTELFNALRTLAEAGQISDQPTPAQLAAFNQAIGQINDGLKTLRTANAENGRRQAQVETLATRAQERSLILKTLIGKNEDADMAEVASELVQRKTVLEASYSVFSQLASLSLVRFLR